MWKKNQSKDKEDPTDQSNNSEKPERKNKNDTKDDDSKKQKKDQKHIDDQHEKHGNEQKKDKRFFFEKTRSDIRGKDGEDEPDITPEEQMKQINIVWIVSLIVSTIVMILVLTLGEGSLNFTLLIFLIVVKFLAGFGIAMGITSGLIFLLTKFEDKFKGAENKKKMDAVYYGVIILFIVLLIYQGPVKIIQSILNDGSAENTFDKLMFLYGIVSLMLNLYIMPLWKNKFIEVMEEKTSDKVKKGLTQGVRTIKRKWFSWRKNYAKAELQSQFTLKEYFSALRQKLAIFMLLFLGIGALAFTPITIIFVIVWLRIYIYDMNELQNYETKLLLIASIVITAIAGLLPFFLEFTTFYVIIKSYYFTVYLAQFFGILLAAYLYLQRFLKNFIEEKRKQKEKEQKEQQKEQEKLLKEQEKLIKEQAKQLKKTQEKSKNKDN